MIAARKQKKEKRAELEKRESNALMRENSEEREGFWENLHSTCSIFFPNSSRFKTRERERERTREPCDREREGEKEREKEITRVERRG